MRSASTPGMGWIRVGEIPDFSVQPRGGLRATTVFYKKL